MANDPDGPVVHLVTADEWALHCPDCGTQARRSKGRWVTGPRDLPVGGRRTRLGPLVRIMSGSSPTSYGPRGGPRCFRHARDTVRDATFGGR
ncbi:MULTISPECIES: transposase family protein [unclassified Streptomyces]|uniref:transposase family protein n=1 Tax=unclassified Streptomyces TaxID=2593676 RepID=UPI002DDA0E72|nr:MULTISPECIES: transposase family protein [unclassified Streptomyces]